MKEDKIIWQTEVSADRIDLQPGENDGFYIWKVVLDPITAGGPYKVVVQFKDSHGKNITIALNDVLFGDVWICGGQSNMQFTVNMAFNRIEELNIAAQYTKVRLFTINRYTSDTPVNELPKSQILQQWSVANKQSVGGRAWYYFSAVCWMYGRKLYDVYKVPIGLLSSNYGGTSVEAWSSPETLSKCGLSVNPSIKILTNKHGISGNDRNKPSGLWNAMIHPLLNTTIYGVIWYQGERNTIINPDRYNCTFPAMIEGWRKEWFRGTHGLTDPSFPFGFGQLGPIGDDCKYSHFPLIRWKQTAQYGYVPNPKQLNTFMAVAMDLLDSYSPQGSIHPRDKLDVAERLLLGARAVAYKESIYWTGPIVDRICYVKKPRGIIVVVNYKASSLQEYGIEVRTNRGFEVSFFNATGTWQPVEIDSWTRTSVSLRLLETTGGTLYGVRYAWNKKPCLFKLCAIYASGTDLPSPPYIVQNCLGSC